MPVLVTGAETAVGSAAVRRLARGGGEVRVYLDAERSGDDDAERYRRLGCKVALGTLDDEAHLETAMEQVHSVVHLAGGPLDDPAEQLDALATVTAAAIGASVSRFLWSTELAAGRPNGNAYLEALSEAAGIVATLPMETVVFRCALRYGAGDALTAALAAGALEGRQVNRLARHAPVVADDLAAALVTADDQRGTGHELRLEVELVGPDEIELGAFLSALRDGAPAPEDPPPLPPWVPDWLSRDAVGGPGALGRQGTSFVTGLEQLRADAGDRP